MSIDKTTISGDARCPDFLHPPSNIWWIRGNAASSSSIVMRQRGLQYREHIAETAPHVLNYEVELILDAELFSDQSTTRCKRLLRQVARRLITSAVRSWWLILVRVTGRESAASRPTARSAWR